MSLIRSLIFIGMTVLIVNCGGKDNKILLESESIGSSYVLEGPGICEGEELTAIYVKSYLQRQLKSIAKVYNVSFNPESWYNIHLVMVSGFRISFSAKTKRGDVYDNIVCRSKVIPTKSIVTETNHVVRLWDCGNSDVRVEEMRMPLQCPIP